jgi:ribA/ribD-fused uncharacterized protein
MSTAPILMFRGRWAKLGNYAPCLDFYEGHAYQSVEHAYQAQKSLDPATQQRIRQCGSPARAKALARSVDLRPDWDDIKLGLMETLLREKFAQEPERTILLSTMDAQLVEGNWWGDTYWGVVRNGEGDGENHLGKLLMKIRDEQKLRP